MVYARCEPSGETAYEPTPSGASVTCTASPPARGSAHTCAFASPPPRNDVNSRYAPSGENDGLEADSSPCVNWRDQLPSAAATHTCERYSDVSSSTIASRTTKATSEPSAE